MRVSEKEAMTPDHCGQKMQTVIQPVHGHVQMNCDYICPVTRKHVSSWQQRRNIFAKHDLRDASDDNPKAGIAKAEKEKAKREALAAQMPGSYEDVYAK